jgi:hypothetical protein
MDGETNYRIGTKNARNIYLVGADGTEHHIGCMFDPVDGPYVVDALNDYTARQREAGE